MKKIPDITNLTTKGAMRTKLAECESTMAVHNRKPQKMKTKIPDTTDFITTPEFNRLTKTNFDTRMKQESQDLAS